MHIKESYECGKAVDGKFHIYVKVVVEKDGQFFIGKWKSRRTPPKELSELNDAKPIPVKDRGPILRPRWTIALPSDDNYIKTPSFEDYMDSQLEAKMEREIEINELIKQRPHPNLATYLGCSGTRGRVSGLCFEKYKHTVLEEVNPRRLSKRDFVASGRPLAKDHMKLWLQSLKSAVGHLHSLGIAHNDITPANIMLDRDNSPVIIDFGSACCLGESLREIKRTRGWHDGGVLQATESNDLDALAELQTWFFGLAEDFKFAE